MRPDHAAAMHAPVQMLQYSHMYNYGQMNMAVPANLPQPFTGWRVGTQAGRGIPQLNPTQSNAIQPAQQGAGRGVQGRH